MDKLKGTIITVLSVLNRPLYRTEIVKFVYMIDEMYYRHFGNTITGLNYKWDSFGPNSEDDLIVKVADELVNAHIIHMSTEPNQYGGISYLYKLEDTNIEITRTLDEIEKYVIKDVTCHYKDYILPDLIQASKETESFKGTEQYDPIKFKQSNEYQEILKSLEEDKSFTDGVKEIEKELVK